MTKIGSDIPSTWLIIEAIAVIFIFHSRRVVVISCCLRQGTLNISDRSLWVFLNVIVDHPVIDGKVLAEEHRAINVTDDCELFKSAH